MIYLNALQITFIVLVPVIVILVTALICYKPIMRLYNKKHFHDAYYKRIYKTTLYGDYFLINNFLFFHEDNKTTTIDHLMCGEKFIYVIKDYRFDGSIKGNIDDQSLILLKDDKQHTKQYVDNPIADSRIITKRLTMVTGIDPSLFIGISIVNDECDIDVEHTDKSFYIVKMSNFEKLIKAIESRQIPQINQEELQRVVNDLARLNRKGKKYVKNNF